MDRIAITKPFPLQVTYKIFSSGSNNRPSAPSKIDSLAVFEGDTGISTAEEGMSIGTLIRAGVEPSDKVPLRATIK